MSEEIEIDIPDALYERAVEIAARRGISVEELIRLACIEAAQLIERYGDDQRPER